VFRKAAATNENSLINQSNMSKTVQQKMYNSNMESH